MREESRNNIKRLSVIVGFSVPAKKSRNHLDDPFMQ